MTVQAKWWLLLLAVLAVATSTPYSILPLGATLHYQHSNTSSWHYYLIMCDDQRNMVSISATVLYGDVDVFVHTSEFVNSTHCPQCVSQGTSPFGEFISTMCNSTSLFISIFSTTRSIFSLACFSSHVSLYNGIPLYAQAYNSDMLYADYYLNSTTSNLTISVSALVGDPDLVVSVENSSPTYVNNTWLLEHFGNDILTIDTRDTDYRPMSTYHIGTFASPNASFVLTAVQSQDYTHLLEGVALAGASKNFYKFLLPEAKGLVCYFHISFNIINSPYLSCQCTKKQYQKFMSLIMRQNQNQARAIIMPKPQFQNLEHYHYHCQMLQLGRII